MPDDVGVLTYLLMQFSGLFGDGTMNIKPTANWLLTVLATIDITLAGLWLALGAEDMNRTFLKKVLVIGFYVFVITTFPTIVNAVMDGFIYVGLKAGGDVFTIDDITDPSKIADYGFNVFGRIKEKLEIFAVVDNAIYLVLGFIIMLSFFMIAIQVFVTIMEFYIIATVGLILIPFGIFKHTSFLAEKTFGAIISFGIKLMVLAFILSIAMPVMDNLVALEDLKIKEISAILLGGLSIAFLSWQAPGLVAGLLSGAPSLSAGSAAGFATAGAVAGGAMGAMVGQGFGAFGGAGKTAADASVAATKAAASGGSAMNTLYREGAAGQVGFGSFASGMSNIGYGTTVGAAKLAAHTVTDAVKSTYAPAIESGKEFGSKLSSTPGSPATASQNPTFKPYTNTSEPKSNSPGFRDTLASLKRAVPPEASPQGSNAVPLEKAE